MAGVDDEPLSVQLLIQIRCHFDPNVEFLLYLRLQVPAPAFVNIIYSNRGTKTDQLEDGSRTHFAASDYQYLLPSQAAGHQSKASNITLSRTQVIIRRMPSNRIDGNKVMIVDQHDDITSVLISFPQTAYIRFRGDDAPTAKVAVQSAQVSRETGDDSLNVTWSSPGSGSAYKLNSWSFMIWRIV